MTEDGVIVEEIEGIRLKAKPFEFIGKEPPKTQGERSAGEE